MSIYFNKDMGNHFEHFHARLLKVISRIHLKESFIYLSFLIIFE